MALFQTFNFLKVEQIGTTYEAMNYLKGGYDRRRFFYLQNGQIDRSKLKFVKHDAFAPGFMASAEVVYHGQTAINIILKYFNVNSQFYINIVLKPFIKIMIYQGCSWHE